jgi:hypothetical protein
MYEIQPLIYTTDFYIYDIRYASDLLIYEILPLIYTTDFYIYDIRYAINLLIYEIQPLIYTTDLYIYDIRYAIDLAQERSTGADAGVFVGGVGATMAGPGGVAMTIAACTIT